MHVATLTITAVIDGGYATLYDRHGRRVGPKRCPLERLRPAPAETADELAWRGTSDVLANRINLDALNRCKRSAWDVKIGAERAEASDEAVATGKTPTETAEVVNGGAA